MRSKIPLDTLYRERYGRTGMVDVRSVTEFFRDTLAISHYVWPDIVEELRYLKRETRQEVEHIKLQYERLRDLELDSTDSGELR